MSGWHEWAVTLAVFLPALVGLVSDRLTRAKSEPDLELAGRKQKGRSEDRPFSIPGQSLAAAGKK